MPLKNIIILFVLWIAHGMGQVYENCELVRKLVHKHNVPVDQVGDFMCIAQHTTNLNNYFPDADAPGLLQILNNIWCSHGANSDSHRCKSEFKKMLDVSTSIDFARARKTRSEHAFNTTLSFTYDDNNCGARSANIVQDCFVDEQPKQMDKTYEHCEVARAFRDVTHLPVDQVGNWVCVAQNTASDLMIYFPDGDAPGLLQILVNIWCSQDAYKDSERCTTDCEKLSEGDDAPCVQRIRVHQKLVYDDNNDCSNQSAEIVRDCLGNEPNDEDRIYSPQKPKLIETYVPPPSPYIATAPQSTTPVLIYGPPQTTIPTPESLNLFAALNRETTTNNRCDPIKCSHHVQNTAYEEIHRWICAVQHRSRFNPSGNNNFHASKALDVFCEFRTPEGSSNDAYDSREIAKLTTELISDPIERIFSQLH